MSRPHLTSILAGTAALTLGLAACSSSGGKEETSGSGSGGAGGVDTPEMTVSLVTHAAPGDTFWDQVRAGAEAAAKKNNVKLEYTADPDGAKQAQLVQQAVDKGVDGIAVTLSKPAAMKANVEGAVNADIPVVALNAGMDEWQDMGALSFFGQDDRLAGEAAGERFTEEGAGKVLCVIQEQGHVGLEARCEGAAEKFDNTEKIYVKGTDTANVQSTITAKLQQDKDITHVFTLGAPFAMVALDSVGEAGSEAKVATVDINKDALQAIKDGKIEWAVDQQPWLQGYLAVDSLWLRVNQGATMGGQEPVFTGPAFVDDSNVDVLLENAS
ncbi:substrate-binding domain-containing protein [Marihabitans asiaticum]|uniref:Simple sugar transport system substrate-binding protein n=1 Tax=Marihabitans asiaticum TaxID=415218 RepID=A0A560WGA5_9MICO|nr:sugar ABC transporter substrate-binding protein [Marihabitans asiaticum]TWD16515.1 simple sugar transport system substrate-binding protein [Marihabitans asiaticum]